MKSENIKRLSKQSYLRGAMCDQDRGIYCHQLLRDPEDSPMPTSLMRARAEYLVFGDEDLLALSDNYPTVTRAELVARL